MANRVRSKRMVEMDEHFEQFLFQICFWHLLVGDILTRNWLAWKIVVPELPRDSSMTGESFLAGGIFGCDASRPDKDLIGIAVQHLLRSDLPQFVIVVLLHWLLRGLGSRLRCNHWIDPATRMLSAETYPSDPEQNFCFVSGFEKNFQISYLLVGRVLDRLGSRRRCNHRQQECSRIENNNLIGRLSLGTGK